MYAPVEDKHTPDPKCCGRCLKPRCLGNDLLRLIIIVLLLLPIILMLSGCEKRRGWFSDTPAIALAECGAGSAGKSEFAGIGYGGNEPCKPKHRSTLAEAPPSEDA